MSDEKHITEIKKVLRGASHLLVHKADFEAAADLIESLQAQLDATIAGQETLQRALAESRHRELAAIEELMRQLKHPADDICSLCQNHVKCEGKNCPEYVKGQGGTINGKQADFKWTCEEFNFGTCDVLENTPCNGCFDNDYKGFEWIGLKEAGDRP